HAIGKDVTTDVTWHGDRASFFINNLMEPREGIVQEWFKGNHADIGGGYEKAGLPDVALQWMIDQSGL
ncbi:MAG: hypothetical protein HOH04_11330, partial [Rhodospirillaceae bacterium]|nr:hypothetical protein [Rhodospirillaceae bacterium]